MDPEAYDQLVKLHRTEPLLAAKIDEQLDRIEANPGDARVRRRLTRSGRLWAISVENYLILWDLDGEIPVVRYLGPDVLR